jgi:hypothetical protein
VWYKRGKSDLEPAAGDCVKHGVVVADRVHEGADWKAAALFAVLWVANELREALLLGFKQPGQLVEARQLRVGGSVAGLQAP